jgi:hypothetical protein
MVISKLFIKTIHDFDFFTKIKIIAVVSLFLHYFHFVNSLISKKNENHCISFIIFASFSSNDLDFIPKLKSLH